MTKLEKEIARINKEYEDARLVDHPAAPPRLPPATTIEGKISNALVEIDWAVKAHKPIMLVGLMSGGDDSLPACWLASLNPAFSGILHINTGIGIEQTREHVRKLCASREWKLWEYKATENTKADGTPDPMLYENLVMRFGFPGAFGHGMMYSRLKERQIIRFERDMGANGRKGKRIMFISGVRLQESKRRGRNPTTMVQQVQPRRVWVAPIRHWDREDCGHAREYAKLPRNPVSERLGMSGECLCVDGDTQIMAGGGWIAAKDVELKSKIWTLQGGEMKLTGISKVHRNGPSPMVELKPMYLRPLILTGNHEILVREYKYAEGRRGIGPMIGHPTWISAEDAASRVNENSTRTPLRKTLHLISVPFRTEENSLELSDECLRLIGHFAAEGCYNWRRELGRPNGIVFTLSNKSKAHAADIEHCIQVGLGLKTHRRDWIDERTGRGFITIRNLSRFSSDFVAKYIQGRYCGEKSFRDVILIAGIEEQKKILDAMWIGDGSRFKRISRPVNVETYTSTSYHLALQVHEMLLRRGLIFGIHCQKPSKHSTAKCYQVRAEGKQRATAFIENGILWTPIHSAKDAGIRETFNFTVKGEPNYRTASGLVHNCGAFAHKGELDNISYWFPETGAYIKGLEKRVKEAGHNWGWEEQPPKKEKSKGIAVEDQFLCNNCNKNNPFK